MYKIGTTPRSSSCYTICSFSTVPQENHERPRRVQNISDVLPQKVQKSNVEEVAPILSSSSVTNPSSGQEETSPVAPVCSPEASSDHSEDYDRGPRPEEDEDVPKTRITFAGIATQSSSGGTGSRRASLQSASPPESPGSAEVRLCCGKPVRR